MADVKLPDAATKGRMSLEQAIARRRCVREFLDRPLTPTQVGQLCWAGQGITDPNEGLRAAPSAGATYPIELYVASADGVVHYRPASHQLKPHLDEDVRDALRRQALDQEMITEAPVTFIIAATVERTSRRYGGRAERYCYIEAGHIAQNMLLQAESLGLGGVPIGAFEDRRVTSLLKLPRGQRVLYMLSIGHPRE